jgi:DNA repair protein RadC
MQERMQEHEHISYQVEYARRERTGPPIGFVPALDDGFDEPGSGGRLAIERPRERMLAFGPAALSNVELIALLLGGGHAEQRALGLLQQIGGIGGLVRCMPAELLAVAGVGEASATAVCAAVELARRIGQLEMPFESSIRGPEDVRRYLRASLRGRVQEVFLVLGLDARQRVRLVREVALGTTAGVELQPREVFRPLVRAASHSVLLVHNHPDGELQPSPADLKLTQRLVELGELLGIPVLDHLIVTDEGMSSLAGLGLLPVPREEVP